MAPNQTTQTMNEQRTPTGAASLQGIDGALFALRDGPEEVLVEALRVIQTVAANDWIRFLLVEAGVVKTLIDRLASCSSSSTRLAIIRTLHPFSVDKHAYVKIGSTDAIPALLSLVTTSEDSIDDCSEALRLLQCLLVSPGLRLQFTQLDGLSVVSSIVLSGPTIVRDRAVLVLWMLAAIPECRAQFTATNALEALVRVLSEDSGDCVDLALSAMALLAENDACRAALIEYDVLAALPRVVQSEARDEVIYRATMLEGLLAKPQSS